MNRRSIEHAALTAVAGLISLLLARQIGLPEAYWSAVTTLVVMQSSLGAAVTLSTQRFAGTAIGAALGGLMASYFDQSALVFAAAVFLSGVICAALHFDRNACRYASITLAIVMLVARVQAAWIVATHRFVEVSIGIGAGLLLTAVWPERAD